MGCGWLGLPLAKHLIKHGYKVKGSSTSKNKLPVLKAESIDAFYVELKEEGVFGDIENFLNGSEILIINIPPGLRSHPHTDYVKQISHLIKHIEASTSILKVIFISSISVYSDDLSIPNITSDTVPNPESESGKQLLEVEQLLQQNQKFDTTILRFGGLFGADRHPAKSLSGKANLKNPDAPVNLIHLDDCIGIIHQIIVTDCWNEVFNACTKPHPSKKDYYTGICNKMNLPVPNYDLSKPSKGKLMDSKKLDEILNYQFQVKLNN